MPASEGGPLLLLRLAGRRAGPRRRRRPGPRDHPCCTSPPDTPTECRASTASRAGWTGRNFTADAPGRKLVGDITYIPADEGWLYLATWLDLATREIVGYSMADHHRASLVVDARAMAAGRGRLQPGCIVHSDRGSEYTSDELRCAIRWLGLRQSMVRTGSCYGNAAAESFFALLKAEIGTRRWPTGPPPARSSSPHAARGHRAHGPAVEAASRPFPTAPVDVRCRCKRPPAVIGGGPFRWWARTVSNRRHLLCKFV
ncbi:DDE-type integrase/transposase/recombinase [Streptomyces avidinii]|uniref:DDE-type integrase/transposase/recombinase n=1 Tax=Streptomyces avidinii TaxID=1895 RepID=UPI0037B7719C